MELERFMRLLNDPARARPELEQMLRNALANDASDFAAAAREALDRRFPGWDRPSHKRGGAKPTVVRFGPLEREFPTSKEAYLWLVEKFVAAKPQLFQSITPETEFLIAGRRRLYFALSAKSLFFGSPHLADDQNNFARLSNGWVASVNLSNPEKLQILQRFAELAKLERDKDWGWHVLESRESNAARFSPRQL